MEKAAAAALRQCRRVRTSKSALKSCRAVSQTAASHSCIAASICPARRSPSIIGQLAPSRLYSSSTSPVEGTIASGASGVPSSQDSSSPVSTPSPTKLTAPAHLNEAEAEIFDILVKGLDCQKLEVQDISGGCGSMYGIEVVSERFRGLGMLKQQRLVNSILGEKIKDWHGVQLRTSAP